MAILRFDDIGHGPTGALWGYDLNVLSAILLAFKLVESENRLFGQLQIENTFNGSICLVEDAGIFFTVDG